MNNNQYPLPADPPAYSATIAAPPTTLRRSLDDTRRLILANGSILKAKKLDPIELIIGKARPPNPSATSARFSSTTSNFTINLTDSPQAGTPETRLNEADPGVRTTGRHYAALVSRGQGSTAIDMLVLGEPQDSIEEALEWMLDRTEVLVTGMLSRHRIQAGSGCCATCARMLKGED